MTSLARQLPPQPERYTVEEYLNWEREADTKSEYYDGKIVMMSGGSPPHSRIAANLIRHLGNALDGTECGTFTSDMKVRSGPRQFVYPDVTVVCGDLEFHDAEKDAVTNPRLVVEVLSSSTEQKDRGAKWLRYQRLPSLTDYLLVWQEQPVVEHFSRDDAGDWRYKAYEGVEVELALPSFACLVPLRQIYAGVKFVDPETP